MIVNTQYLEGLILSVLAESEKGKYPYEIFGLLGDPLKISESTIYSLCKRMEKKELIWADINSHIIQGRARKYYFITDKGMHKLESLKEVYQAEKSVLDRCFGVRKKK